MILNSKQLEELENIQDASGEFGEESSDSDSYVEGVENALAWRRGMIERAVTNIRKLIRKPLDSLEGMASGSLVYLKESKRFVRIHQNADGRSELSFVGPTLEVPSKAQKAARAKESKASKTRKTVKAKAEKAAVSSAKAKTAPKAEAKKAAKAPVAKPETAKKKATPKAKAVAAKSKTAAPKKASKGLEAATKTRKVAKPAASAAKKPATKSKPKPSSATSKAVKTKATAKQLAAKKKKKKAALRSRMVSYRPGNIEDPVADPNGYIQGNFRLMSNKELAQVTGLSEHTIRRKLGEWGLKRI